MKQSIIEYARELAVKRLFEARGFSTAWANWRDTIKTDYWHGVNPTARQIYNLGDHLRDLFRTTGNSGRSQEDISIGGANWEALICWYLNLCLIGRRTVVIKHNKNLIPIPVSDAITVNYGNFRSNTESDLIAITFPDKEDYRIDKKDIEVRDENGISVDTSRNGKYQFLPVINALSHRDFAEIEIHIIQCKTNWNDNAQIPMLWDAVYSANTFRNGISVGINGYSIHDVSRFTYSFVTVPSNKIIKENGNRNYKIDSTSVLRVANLSGGNYWGLPSETGVASSVKEILERNLKAGETKGFLQSINDSLPSLSTIYTYFGL